MKIYVDKKIAMNVLALTTYLFTWAGSHAYHVFFMHCTWSPLQDNLGTCNVRIEKIKRN